MSQQPASQPTGKQTSRKEQGREARQGSSPTAGSSPAASSRPRPTFHRPTGGSSGAGGASSGGTSAGSPRPGGSSPRGSQNPVVVLLLVSVFLCLAMVFVFTGEDPLGLFSGTGEVEPAAITAVAPQSVELSGEHWQVYFTDPATINDPNQLEGSIPEKFIERIEAAQTSIHIAAFEFNLTPVAEALIAAKKRGVEVLWVTDDENGLDADEDDDRGQFAMLKKAKIKVVDDGRSALMHNKFAIFDGQVVWTGSTNFTTNDTFRNNNNVIVFDSPEIAAIYEREFAEMWDGEFGPRSPSTAGEQSVTLDGMQVQVLFSSEDEVLARIIPLVQSARQSIRFMAFSFTHDGLEKTVEARAKAGVDLKGIFETRGSETEYSALPKLFCAGFPVRQDGNPGTFHHKVIVIDGRVVVTGSLNFSDNADQSNDENTVILTSPQIAQLYLQEFDRRWAEAVEPESSAMNCR